MQIYCFRCKVKTDTKDVTTFKCKNNRSMMKGKCTKCETKKCKPLSNLEMQRVELEGDGFLTDIKDFVEKKVRKVLHGNKTLSFPGERHLPGQSYTGPGTELKKRLDLMKVGLSLPVSDIDRASLQHDANFVRLRNLWEKGMPKEEVLRLTQKVDDHYIRRVMRSKNDSIAMKRAVQLAFKGKKLHENIFGEPLFVKGGTRDPHINKIGAELDFSFGNKLIPK